MSISLHHLPLAFQAQHWRLRVAAIGAPKLAVSWAVSSETVSCEKHSERRRGRDTQKGKERREAERERDISESVSYDWVWPKMMRTVAPFKSILTAFQRFLPYELGTTSTVMMSPTWGYYMYVCVYVCVCMYVCMYAFMHRWRLPPDGIVRMYMLCMYVCMCIHT